MRRWLIVLVLAFGWLFSTPASADVREDGNTLQFSYSWGSATRTFTDSVVTVTVVNDITNKIGGNGEVIDTYRITLGEQVIEVTKKHGARDYVFTITGSQTITLEGIDRGFWAGYYGPVMTIAAVPIAQPLEPVTQSPETLSATISDPITSPTLSASASPEPSPEPQSTPEPLPSPSPSPEPVQPQPTPIATPSETPTASFPTQSPEPESTQSPTSSSETSTVSPQQTEQPTPQATPSEPQVQPIIEPSPVQSSEVISEEPVTTAPEVAQVEEETFSDTVSSSIQASVTQAIGAVTEAVGELVRVFQSAGLDMTPEQRKAAQEVVVSSVLVSQIVRKIN